MKKLIALILTLATMLTVFASCSVNNQNSGSGSNNDSGQSGDSGNKENEATKIRVGFMSGPTGMGMAKLINDNGGVEGNDKYSFVSYTDTSLAKADLTKGDIDVICLPTNEALAYYNSVDKNTRVLAVNCLNSLYLISDGEHSASSLADLEGQTIYTCKNGTPRIILNYIIKALDLDIEVSYTVNDKDMNTPADVRTQVIAGALPYAVIPEPIVTASTLKNNTYSIDIDLADEWAKIPSLAETPVTMGCVVASQEFISKNPGLVKDFLAEYEASVNYIGNSENLENAAKYVADAKIMDAAPAAKKALTNLGEAISYIDGKDMKSALTAFYTALGMALPADEFYYE